MKEVRVLAASGVCGSGFRKESLEEAMGRRPHFVGCDGGQQYAPLTDIDSPGQEGRVSPMSAAPA